MDRDGRGLKMSQTKQSHKTRRDFIKDSGRAAATSALAAGSLPYLYAGEDNTINVALVGCGGRGTGAVVDALSTTSGPTRLIAVADVFQDRIDSSLKAIEMEFPSQISVPKDRQFVGFDGYKDAIDCLQSKDVVILATPPAFRPHHLEYAVNKGCNVFMEKSFAVDSPGIRRVIQSGKLAETKNLKIASGLMSRHYPPLEQAIEQVHKGLIGDVITCWAYRVHQSVGFSPKRGGMTEMAHQVRNYSNFTWLNGSFLLDWLIHNLDVCCWVKDGWPVAAQGQGGRQVRQEADQLFDHYAVEYSFEDGTRLLAQGRHMDNCWGFFGDVIHGTKGSAVLGEGIPQPKIFRNHKQTPEDMIWHYQGEPANAYRVEHERLFKAIREDIPYNETERSAYAAMVGILGRMAAESGQRITWQEAIDSNTVLAPGIEGYTMETVPPAVPDSQGKYPIAMPGISKVL
jgi:predicted dehydrogenase